MTDENQAKLLTAYKYAIEAEQDGIAELLEDVILGEMEPRPTVTLRGDTPRTASLDNMPLIPSFGSRNVVTCELGKEDTK